MTAQKSAVAGLFSAATLASPDIAAAEVAPDWAPLVQSFAESLSGVALQAFLAQRMKQGARIYPPHPLRMLALTPLANVRVVIVGQDPYHGPGQGEGLAFSVPEGQRIPPSLRNIYQELSREFGQDCAPTGSLVAWAKQGVLLLNTCLTVEEAQPGSHARQGWESLTAAILSACAQGPKACVFMLWGAHAQAFASGLDASRHLVLQANHPSPLSARRGPSPFIGCGHFGQTNRWLAARNEQTIDWIANQAKTMA